VDIGCVGVVSSADGVGAVSGDAVGSGSEEELELLLELEDDVESPG
jgi:hypothetical protein